MEYLVNGLPLVVPRSRAIFVLIMRPVIYVGMWKQQRNTSQDMFSTLRRYVKSIPEAVVAELSFRVFMHNGESKRLMDRGKAAERDTQVRICATWFPHFYCASSACSFSSVEFGLEPVY